MDDRTFNQQILTWVAQTGQGDRDTDIHITHNIYELLLSNKVRLQKPVYTVFEKTVRDKAYELMRSIVEKKIDRTHALPLLAYFRSMGETRWCLACTRSGAVCLLPRRRSIYCTLHYNRYQRYIQTIQKVLLAGVANLVADYIC